MFLNSGGLNLNIKQIILIGVFLYPRISILALSPSGGPRGRVVKVADFSALDHSIISPMWVRTSLGARVTCGTSQVLLAGVSGGFPRVLQFSPHLPIDPSRYECKSLKGT